MKRTEGLWLQGRGKIVAQRDPPNGPYEIICKTATGTADACLIAAAPELLEACEAALISLPPGKEHALRSILTSAIKKAGGTT